MICEVCSDLDGCSTKPVKLTVTHNTSLLHSATFFWKGKVDLILPISPCRCFHTGHMRGHWIVWRAWAYYIWTLTGTMQDSFLHHHNQDTKLEMILWKNGVNPSSRIQSIEAVLEVCGGRTLYYDSLWWFVLKFVTRLEQVELKSPSDTLTEMDTGLKNIISLREPVCNCEHVHLLKSLVDWKILHTWGTATTNHPHTHVQTVVYYHKQSR